MQTFFNLYLLGASFASVIFVVVGFRSFGRTSREAWPTVSDETRSAAITSPGDNGNADVRLAVAVAVDRVSLLLQDRGCCLEVAVRPDLCVRVPAQVLADTLEDMLIVMLRRRSHRLLLSAAPQGSQVAISLGNDAPVSDHDALEAAMRGIAERIALRGGSLDIDTTPGEGAVATLRLAATSSAVTCSADTTLDQAAPITAAPVTPPRDVAKAL